MDVSQLHPRTIAWNLLQDPNVLTNWRARVMHPCTDAVGAPAGVIGRAEVLRPREDRAA